jgi:quercetin dioxygenase-like cupin family protein
MDYPFDPKQHIVNLRDCPHEVVSDGAGSVLRGVYGLSGAGATLDNGDAIGVDSITMAAGTAFELHTHPGAHILVVQEGKGCITVDGVDYVISEGDTIYVPARYPHGVSASIDCGVSFHAFGVPHMPVSSPDRMTLVNAPD